MKLLSLAFSMLAQSRPSLAHGPRRPCASRCRAHVVRLRRATRCRSLRRRHGDLRSFATSNTVPLNGEIEIVATAIENGTTATTPTTPDDADDPRRHDAHDSDFDVVDGAGTPVQNGTVITFTTTLGRIEPAEARTKNGQVRVRFISSGQSGTATITAFSGGASGKLENLRVGTRRGRARAAERDAGSAAAIGRHDRDRRARRRRDAAPGIPGVPVTFTADQRLARRRSATTDSSGVARTTLTASRTTIVTANVAGKTATVTVNLNPRTGISITGPTTPVVGRHAGDVHRRGRRGTASTFATSRSTSATAHEARSERSARRRRFSTSTRRKGPYRAAATATEASGFTEPSRRSSRFCRSSRRASSSRRRTRTRAWRDRHLHRDGVGCDLHDPALRVELRRRRLPADGDDDRQPRDRDVQRRRHEGHHRAGHPGDRPAGEGTTSIGVS